MVQWLRLHASTSGDMDLIPGLGTKIPHALPQKREKKNVCVCVCVCVCIWTTYYTPEINTTLKTTNALIEKKSPK